MPNITGNLSTKTFESTGNAGLIAGSGAFQADGSSDTFTYSSNAGYRSGNYCTFNASRSSSIYGNSSTVQPQTIKTLVYIVIATVTKTDIQVDIDEIATDLNGKADTDLSNAVPSQSFKDASIGWGQPDYSAAVAITLSLNSSVTYQAAADGFINFTLTSFHGGQASIFVNGNDVVYVKTPATSDITPFSGLIPVANGDPIVITCSGADSSYINRPYNYAEFVPCKGA